MSYADNFFIQNVKNLISISKLQQKNQKKFFLCWIIALELVMRNSPYNEENTCHRH